MKNLLTAIVAALLCLTASAQDTNTDPVQIMRERLTQGRVTMNYYFKTEKGKTSVVDKGVMTVEGNCFCSKGSGIEIRNDGRTQWYIDPKAKEIYIEDSNGLEDLFSNPKIYEELLSDLQISDNEISGNYHNGRSGDKTFFRMTNIKSSPAVNDSTIFKFDARQLDSEWLVTDLRERK